MNEIVKKAGFIFVALLEVLLVNAQPGNCILKPPQVTINFGSGNVDDFNTGALVNYQRVDFSCPPDGYYAIVPATGGCFHDDWHTLEQDHTGNHGNMLLVNAGYRGGVFLKTPIQGLKNNTMYELGLWLMNLCRPTKKCPSILLPDLNIRLETLDGKAIATIRTGNVPRVELPWWTQHRAYFRTPSSAGTMMLVMSDNNEGGCGNDFALDDITFRECVPQTTQSPPPARKTATPKQQPLKPLVNRVAVPKPKRVQAQAIQQEPATTPGTSKVAQSTHSVIASIPFVIRTRENPLVKKIVTEAGEIRIDVYDNGEIDGDSVTIYHNNVLVKSHMELSAKPITFTITVDPSAPHHEIIMVAENLGSIPPNTALMVVTTPDNRYEVFISSDEQKNAKVVFDLKK